MNNWLDIKLKIMRFFRKHKKKIVIILIIWSIIIAINYYLKYKPKEITFKNTYQPHSPVIDITDEVPERYKQPIENLVHNYIEYCNNKEYEKAYELLSNNYKERYIKNIENFKKYVDTKFESKKIYSIQNYSNLKNTYVYQIHLLDDIMANGTTDEYVYIEEKFVIKEENGILKIALNGFCGQEELDIDVEDDYMQIIIEKKYIEYDNSTYVVKFKNKTKNYIVLSDVDLHDAIQIKLPNDIRTAKYLTNSNIVILPNETREYEITFAEYFDDNQEATNLLLNSIQILPQYTGNQENVEKERENAVKLYSLSIDLIPQK